jgi:hypothetical protein
VIDSQTSNVNIIVPIAPGVEMHDSSDQTPKLLGLFPSDKEILNNWGKKDRRNSQLMTKIVGPQIAKNINVIS